MKLVHLISSVLVLCCASWGSAQEVRIEKDLAYLEPDRAEKLDLYMPAKADKGQRFPGIVIIHGGGFTGGDKGGKREQNIGSTLAANGYVCISINYALAKPGQPTWPRNLHDCKQAVRFLRKHAEKYCVLGHPGPRGGRTVSLPGFHHCRRRGHCPGSPPGPPQRCLAIDPFHLPWHPAGSFPADGGSRTRRQSHSGPGHRGLLRVVPGRPETVHVAGRPLGVTIRLRGGSAGWRLRHEWAAPGGEKEAARILPLYNT